MTMEELKNWLQLTLATFNPIGEFQRGYKLALQEVLSKASSVLTPGNVACKPCEVRYVEGEVQNA